MLYAKFNGNGNVLIEDDDRNTMAMLTREQAIELAKTILVCVLNIGE